MAPPLQTLLYVSKLAKGVPTVEVQAIADSSRIANEVDGITGVLVFDSTSFAQLVEGPPAAIDDLLERLRSDRRHVDVEVLVHTALGQGRRFANWHLAYAEVPQSRQGIASLRRSHGADALDAFELLLTDLPPSAGTAVPSSVRLERLRRDMDAATSSSVEAIRRSREAIDRCLPAGKQPADRPHGQSGATLDAPEISAS